ncbi:MAG: UTP--glucose-1-phosphate uridylyltransferase GalU [Candidatus Schekmanbacteria bacterium]|nr:UTP--glucose-1-phosphate uridylyltransferase GalU [Candidatus Schekmanbacteria bacterium]
MKIKKAVIPVAGLGTRFLPATKASPKEMLPLVDKPIIQYVVEEAIASGIEHITMVTGRGKRAIEDHFDISVELESALEEKNANDMLSEIQKISNMVSFNYTRQKKPLGLGHAILCAAQIVGDEPFAVFLADDIISAKKPCMKQMMDVYDEVGSTVIAIQEVAKEETKSYGIIEPESSNGRLHKIANMVEKPDPENAPSRLAIIGRYILVPEIFDILRETPPGKNGEIQLTDALKKLLEKQSMYGYEFEGKRYDTGDKLGFLKATVEFALNRPLLGSQFREYLKSLNIN